MLVADYRGGDLRRAIGPLPPDQVTYVDDGLAVVDYVRSRPYVGPKRISL